MRHTARLIALIAGLTTLIACGCEVDGVHYNNGETVPSGDCNTCVCEDGGVSCTTMGCPTTCTDADGGTRTEGETWEQNCNSCTCEADGSLTCTSVACDTAI
ncbi:MAG: hypothetical protein H6739_36890 [Alphaproteobacteria bacterium]|nr:hypothetical protein [Alphaproteobacteria bacterium]